MKRLCLLLLPLILYAFSDFAVAQTQACPVTYSVANSWSGGFQAGFTIKNTGTTPINGWTVTWTFPGNQQITQLWGGTVTSQGETITVTNLSWDGSIPPGGTMNSVGFTANGASTPAPSAFLLNGVACGSQSGGTPPATPTGLAAKAGNGQVALSWNASTGAVSYNVERSTTNGGPYSIVGTPTVTNFTDTTVTNGISYFYVVNAANLAGTSANSAQVTATPSGSIPNVTITINPGSTQPISPWIYGINNLSQVPNAPKVTLNRLGGNRWTAYNWTTNASNAGSDFNFQSDNFLSSSSIPGEAVRPTIASDIAAGAATLMTVQLQGLVSADEAGPVSTANPPDLTRFKTVVDKKSTVSSAPFTTTPLTTGPVFMDEFVWAMDQKFPGVGIFGGSTQTPVFVNLDNEPELWSSTHLEVQGPNRIAPGTYITNTITLAKALKDQFPNMTIFGPAHYGFLGVYNWQTSLTSTPNGMDWFPDMYLQALASASATYGRPLVDVYDFHWYPEDYDANSLRVTSMTSSTLTDAQMQLVVQAPRNLWDATFTDPGNSNPWPNSVLGNTPLQFLPRLKAKIASEFPSMKLSISEYEAGAFNNIAGTVAQADELGVFASQGLFAAMFWPPGGTFDYSMAGFRAYRNFDGANSNFGDTLMQSTSSNVQNVVVYASKDSTKAGRVVFVAINRANSPQIAAITGAPLSGTAHMYQITATTAQGQTPITPVAIGQTAVSGSSLTLTLPAYSVTTIDVH
jgi:glycosyl hydrolase family 44/cellulose binding protein with CBM2 domain